MPDRIRLAPSSLRDFRGFGGSGMGVELLLLEVTVRRERR
jgi:hypothetical protein